MAVHISATKFLVPCDEFVELPTTTVQKPTFTKIFSSLLRGEQRERPRVGREALHVGHRQRLDELDPVAAAHVGLQHVGDVEEAAVRSEESQNSTTPYYVHI